MIHISINFEIKGSTRDFAYNHLKEQIINWDLKPGTKISEKEVSQSLNVSRTPVREAFLQLAQEELLIIIPQRGTIVSKIDLNLVEEGRFVREHIEKAVVREVCTKVNDNQLFQLETNLTMQELCLEKGSHNRLFQLDEEFHQLLFEICNKKRTWNNVRRMNSHFDRLRMLRLAENHDFEVVVGQHREIFKNISERNPDKAESIMEKHMKLVFVELKELKAKNPEYFN
ncbi:GntR family transcriptional regulator [Oceanobacillus sp. CFH 90083]|uniref:GntR family transcriptional regulator n=1 Tax=Oceanobacillus sp. CFH 90083 TaxID=2592336 RepID=UPI00128D344D|nr:GntR family transcriptional regulator [Oceanobacillus sp. CFH 90083]